MDLPETIRYSIDDGARMVRLVFSGSFSFDEWVGTMRAIWAEPAYRSDYGFLLDRRGAPPPSVDAIRAMVTFIGSNGVHFAGSRWAIVASGPADYGMARMAEFLAADHPTTLRAFHGLEEAEAWLRGPRSPAEGADRPVRVLVVDDEEADRLKLGSILEGAGYEVRAASDGVEALRIFIEEPVHAVVTDLVMPGRDGLNLITNLQGIGPHVPIIAVSGKGQTGLALASIIGAGRLLEKPVGAPALLSAIADALSA